MTAGDRSAAPPKMHEGEVPIDEPLVAQLLESQFPQWADLPLRRVEPAGTDNAIFRLGDALSVRLPRIEWATSQPLKEHTWLPRLAPLVSLAIPEPIALGEPGEGYPWQWSICTWLPGEMATPDRLDNPADTVADVATFIAELRALDPTNAPRAKWRGGPMISMDEDTRASIDILGERIDQAWALTEWKAACDAAAWSGEPVWSHGDLDARNLLAIDGRLSGVLDFSALSIGDPAADVMAAWKLFDPRTRPAFREALEIDEATWLRARGCVLSQAVMILSYYTLETNPTLITEAGRWLTELQRDLS